ncbi:MAG: potassium transporter KefB [Cytophagaceae bacterium]|nr:potassium transporter KefB [Cytophagaceae bacterium]|tara:strand:+ start:1538 stop:1870 length:333 start_codon:yes stop_codon:yes gene_type:complete
MDIQTTLAHLSKRKVIIRMLIGYCIGLGIISLFVFSVNKPNPGWGAYWQLRPLIITPLATACGALSYFLVDFVSPKKPWATISCYVLSTLVFVISLWLGIVLGLDGTLWN